MLRGRMMPARYIVGNRITVTDYCGAAMPAQAKIRILVWVQGFYYAVTGIWPLLHAKSFLVVTGPKVDVWLVQTVGALLAITGVALLRAGRRGFVSSDLAVIAAGEALVLAAVDAVFVSTGRISAIYLADAVPELVLVGWWVAAWPRNADRNSSDSAAQRR